MGMNERGKRDGTGPYKGSFRRRGEGRRMGRRRAAGEECPWDYSKGRWRGNRA